MPIFEYHCKKCKKDFESIFTLTQFRMWPWVEKEDYCPKCSKVANRIMSRFSYNKIPKLEGIDDTDDLTLGKMAIEGGIPAEFKPTNLQIKLREERKQLEKEYGERVKKYDLDKPTKAELLETSGKKEIEVVSR